MRMSVYVSLLNSNADGSILTRIFRTRNKTLNSDQPGTQVRASCGQRVNRKGTHKSQLQKVEARNIPASCRWRILPTMDIALWTIRYICEVSGNVSQFFPFGNNQCLSMRRNTDYLRKYFLIGGEGYKSSVRHYLESSCEIAMAAVQPGRVEDLSMIVSFLVQHSPKCRLLTLYCYGR
jgi:hypothetical protein